MKRWKIVLVFRFGNVLHERFPDSFGLPQSSDELVWFDKKLEENRNKYDRVWISKEINQENLLAIASSFNFRHRLGYVKNNWNRLFF